MHLPQKNLSGEKKLLKGSQNQTQWQIKSWNETMALQVKCKPLSRVTFPPFYYPRLQEKNYKEDKHKRIFATLCPMVVSICLSVMSVETRRDWKEAQNLWELMRMKWMWLDYMLSLDFVQYIKNYSTHI